MNQKQRPIRIFKLSEHFTCLQQDLPGILELGPSDSEGEEGLQEGNENTFLVECIKDRRVVKGKVEYLVKWAGWKDTASTWQAEEMLQTVRKEIDRYNQRELISSSSGSYSSNSYEITLSPSKWEPENESTSKEQDFSFNKMIKSNYIFKPEEQEHHTLIHEDISDYFERTGDEFKQ